MSGPFKLKYKNSAFPFKTDEKEIKDDIRYMPGDSDWDSRIPRDPNIMKQHILNRDADDSNSDKMGNKDISV